MSILKRGVNLLDKSLMRIIGRHVSIDVLIAQFPPKAQAVVEMVTDFFSAGVFGVAVCNPRNAFSGFWLRNRDTEDTYVPLCLCCSFRLCISLSLTPGQGC